MLRSKEEEEPIEGSFREELDQEPKEPDEALNPLTDLLPRSVRVLKPELSPIPRLRPAPDLKRNGLIVGTEAVP